jgi:hypothetical protein
MTAVRSKIETKLAPMPLLRPELYTAVEEFVGDEKDEDSMTLLTQLTMPMDFRRSLFAAKLGTPSMLSRNRNSGRGWEDYSLRIAHVGTVSVISGTSVTNVYVSDPSQIPLSQWSTWATLFDEVKLEKMTVQIAPLGNASPAVGVIAIGNFPASISTPTTVQQVVVGSKGTILSPLMVKPHVQTMTISDLVYAATSAPSTIPGAGCPGSIKLYASAGGTGAILTYSIVAHYHVRGRV